MILRISSSAEALIQQEALSSATMGAPVEAVLSSLSGTKRRLHQRRWPPERGLPASLTIRPRKAMQDSAEASPWMLGLKVPFNMTLSQFEPPPWNR